MTDDNGDKFVRFTITGADPIIGSSDITQGLNMDNEGEYVAIKYRTSSEKGNRFAINFLNSLTTELNRDYDCDLGRGLVNDGQCGFIVVTHRDGTAQEETVQLDVDKLAAVGDIAGITNQNHFIDRIRQRFVAADLENALFHTFSLSS